MLKAAFSRGIGGRRSAVSRLLDGIDRRDIGFHPATISAAAVSHLPAEVRRARMIDAIFGSALRRIGDLRIGARKDRR
jgi:hypothetical protein